MKDKSKIAEEISIVMPKIARKITSGFLHSVDMSPTQIFTIMTIFESKECRFTDLSNELNVSAPTATGLVDRLEKLGYAQRIHDKNDRRAINISLTSKGNKMALKLRAIIKKRWEEILSRLSQSDSENYLRIIKKVQRVI